MKTENEKIKSNKKNPQKLTPPPQKKGNQDKDDWYTYMDRTINLMQAVYKKLKILHVICDNL